MRVIGALLTAGMLTGCTTWHNENISDPAALKRQLVIDEGYCTRVAVGVVPMPEIRVYDPSQQSYTINGSVSHGAQTSYYTGTVSPTAGGFAGGFASGVSQGAALGTAIRVQNERGAIVKGCMFNLGWSNTPQPPRAAKESSTINAPTTVANTFRNPPVTNQKTISCDQWSNDIAATVDHAYQFGLQNHENPRIGEVRDLLRKSLHEYLDKRDASGRDHLIAGYILEARYRIEDLSSDNFPKYVNWECEQDWSGIGLSKPQ